MNIKLTLQTGTLTNYMPKMNAILLIKTSFIKDWDSFDLIFGKQRPSYVLHTIDSHYGNMVCQGRDTKLDRFLTKHQYMKIL